MTRAMTTHDLSTLSASPRLPLAASLAVRFAYVVTEWETRRKTRKQLSKLDNHLLEDIGISRLEADRERALRFWQV